MTPTTFICSICEAESVRICTHCTKDACANHLCERCGRCSDCCNCELRLDDETSASQETANQGHPVVHPSAQPDRD